MAQRRIVTLPYGEGLERSKGVMVINPATFDAVKQQLLARARQVCAKARKEKEAVQ